MGFFKTLFGGKEDTSNEQEASKQQYNFEVLTYDAVQALHVGKTDYAIACLRRALTIHEDEETRYRLATAYQQKDDLEAAAAEFEQLCSMAPDNATYPLALADTRFQLEQYTQMEQACNTALSIDSTLAMPHYLLAKKAFAQSDWTQAADECTAALAQKDDYAEARLLRAQAFWKIQQADKAEADVLQLMEEEQGTDEVLLLLAQIRASQGQIDEAVELYRNSIDINPFVPAAYIELSSLLKSAGRHAEAASVMDEAVEQLGVSPEDAQLLQQGDSIDMVEYMRNAYNVLNPYQFNIKL